MSVCHRAVLIRTDCLQQIVSVLLDHTVSAKQVTNFWNVCWDKYKACHEWAEHTGGGDGDEDRELGAEDGKGSWKFSKAVLDEFENSILFDQIDTVYVCSHVQGHILTGVL